MSDLRELYQSTILDHNKKPRNFRRPEGTNRESEGYNPLCGDKVTVYLSVEDDVVKDVGFQGQGCAISTASASVMTQLVKGKSVEEALAMFDRFHALVAGELDPEETRESLGKLAVFAGVRAYPTRVKCATLAWHTLRAAARGEGETVTTE